MLPLSCSSSSNPPPNYNHLSLEELLNETIDSSPMIRRTNIRKLVETRPHLSAEEQEKLERKKKFMENQRPKNPISKLIIFREELHARMDRLNGFLSTELNWEKVVQVVFEKVKEFEQLLKPHFGTGVNDVLKQPETYRIIEEYHRQAQSSQNVEFKTLIKSEEEEFLKARQEYNDYEKGQLRDGAILSNLKIKVELTEIRLEVYRLWVQVERTKLMAAKLKVARDWMKKEVWEKIVSQYVNFTMQLQKTSSSPDALEMVAKAVLFFAPFSTGGQKTPIQVAEVSSSTSSGDSRIVKMVLGTPEKNPCDSTTDLCSSTSSESPLNSGTSNAQLNPMSETIQPTSSARTDPKLNAELVKKAILKSEGLWNPPKQFDGLKRTAPVGTSQPKQKMTNFSIESILGTAHSEPRQHSEVNSHCSSGSWNQRNKQSMLIPQLPLPTRQIKRPLTSAFPAHDVKRPHLEPPVQNPLVPSLDDFLAFYTQPSMFHNMAQAPPQSVNNNWTNYMSQGYQGY